jgi:excinuclease UvrABC ATPase subunit
MMAGVATVCEGRRFQASALDYRFGGLNIAEVLDQSKTRSASSTPAKRVRRPRTRS